MPRPPRRRSWLRALLLPALLAQPLAAAEHRWLGAPPRAEQPAAHFTNLADGAQIETPFLLKFGLSRHGLAPSGKAVAGAGHLHLLIDRELPLDFGKPLPADARTLHFDAGEMEAVLDLPPGRYRLRLLLADHRHVPRFVFSRPIAVEVKRRDGAIDPRGLQQSGVAILEPRAGESLRGPLRVRLHASGLGIAPIGLQDPALGHLRLVAERRGAPVERIALDGGQTELWLAPPPGRYRLWVERVANTAAQTVTAASVPIDVTILR